jgi:hypothetical protein
MIAATGNDILLPSRWCASLRPAGFGPPDSRKPASERYGHEYPFAGFHSHDRMWHLFS